MRALVTGGGSGIGAWAARRLADDGFDVTVADVDPAAVAEELGATAINLDVRDEEQVAGAMGGVDVLVNAVSFAAPAGLVDTTVDLWLDTMDLNVRSAFLCAKHAVPVMASRGRGAIVNVLGAPTPGHFAYGVSQGALATLTRTLAIEHGGDNIRVNAVCAGPAPPEEVADAIVYLATADFVTGTILTVDGGSTVSAFGTL